jgi:uncharacterized membrane protein YdcZ (DUF606 family)
MVLGAARVFTRRAFYVAGGRSMTLQAVGYPLLALRSAALFPMQTAVNSQLARGVGGSIAAPWRRCADRLRRRRAVIGGLVIDRLGLFDFAVREISPFRVRGVAIVLVGALMVRFT